MAELPAPANVDLRQLEALALAASPAILTPLLTCITEVAQTGHVGDGLVWITEVERAAFIFKTTVGSPSV